MLEPNNTSTTAARPMPQRSDPQSTEQAAHLPFHRPSLSGEEEAEVLDTLRSRWLTTGTKTRRFEEEFAAYVGARHAVALNSCTATLHLALVDHGVGPGDEVITTPISFASTATVIEHVVAKPVFVDVLADTLNMNPKNCGQPSRRGPAPQFPCISPVSLAICTTLEKSQTSAIYRSSRTSHTPSRVYTAVEKSAASAK